MYNIKRHCRKFDTDDEKAMEEYSGILNNPLCSVIAEKYEKLTKKHFDDEGKPTYQEDFLIKVVTWEEKVLA